MKLNDLKISTQLRLGLGVILLLVVFLGAVAWRQGNELWRQTETIYEHPYRVRMAIDDLEADIQTMRLEFRNMVLAADEEERKSAAAECDVREADAVRQFQIIFDNYLGPRADVETTRDHFVRWLAVRKESFDLVRAGKVAGAMDRVRDAGDIGKVRKALMGSIAKIDDFAQSKADEIYRKAAAQHDSLSIQLAVIVASILLLSLFIVWVLLNTINGPLRHLTATASQLRQGKMDVRSRFFSANEFGALSASFNAMADAIQKEMLIEQNAAELAHIMLREDEVHAFCHEMLKALLLHTGSQVGAVYFLNEDKTAYEHFESIGLGVGGRAAFSATEREGELGGALAARQIQRITDIPADSRFTFAAVSGEFHPREILTIPVLSDHTVAAVISLASIRAYDAPSVRLVNDIWSVLTARVNGVLAFQKIQNLAERLNLQNHELDTQKEELSIQTDELTRQNAELEMQKWELDEANRLKSAFLSNMSHELRTPLNSVIALSGVLNRRLAKTIPEVEHGYLEVIERNGKALLSLINDLLDISRIEAGREDINVSRFSVRELSGGIVAMIAPQAWEKKIDLLNEVPEDLPLLASDPDKCRHILENLVGNAVKFTERGKVTITAEIENQKSEIRGQKSEDRGQNSAIRISVKDTGIGIAADQIAHIFDEFRQADSSTSRKYGGTGLGLAIAKKYAGLLGGTITVKSTPGHGSTFTLRLPWALPQEEPASRPLGHEASQRRDVPHTGGTPVPPGQTSESRIPQGKDILLVEDNEPAIIQLTYLLEAEGYRVHVAHDGEEGLAHIGQSLPDAMILDLMMPHVDGFQVLKAIRGAERTAELPVLILTAKHVTKQELSFLKGNHVHQLIQKGDINKNELLAAVARMVAPSPEKPAAPPRRRRPARPGKPVVLVVEDNPDNLRTIKALLEDRYHVVEAEDGRTCVEQARKHLPDLILTDIALPGLDGIQALEELRQDASLREIPVVAVTASAMKGDREEILSRGFDGYLSKPLDHDALRNLLREFFEDPRP
ncbi:MAG: response regulator [Verrucomicrobiae bacterium]